VTYDVYILELQDGRLYVGHTRDLSRRQSEHVRGKGSRTSRLAGAGRLLFSESFPSRTEAVQRERQIKKWSRAKKLALASGDMAALHALSARHSHGPDSRRAESRMP
jgi:predicted GIY-YIG superfamily endonuclease